MATITLFYIYGDQHHGSSEALKKGEKVLSDGGSQIHTNLFLRINAMHTIDIYTYQDNFQVRNFFGNSQTIRIKEFPTLSGLFKKSLLRLEVLTRCIYPGLLFLFKRVDTDYLITQTDFLPDTWAAFLVKLRNPRIIWVASFFLAAPKPWQKDSPYHGKRYLIGLGYWLQQLPSLFLIKMMADKVIVTSDPDVGRFLSKKRDRSKIIVFQGGVDIGASEKYLSGNEVIPVSHRKYDACFVGRFHFQKGVLDLIDIWHEVCRLYPEAKLAMIGNGPLEDDVVKKIAKYRLDKNIDLLGFMDGEQKNDVFKQSKIMVHPATYDSGGMAMAGGMAWGLPGVSFDLEALKTYYPKGVIKIPLGDNVQFADNIVRLIRNEDLYSVLSLEARDLILKIWDWDKRVEALQDKIFPATN